MDAPSPDRAMDELRRWLNEESRFVTETGDFDLALVEKLLAAGLPIARFTTGIPSLHPQVDSFSTLWEEGKGLSFRTFRLTPEQATRFQDTPVFRVYNEGRTVRSKLEGPPPPDEPKVLREFRAEGITEYVAIPLPFSDGSNKVVTCSTRRAGGFTDQEVALLESLRHDLASAMEIRYLRHLAGTLMDTYVGPVAGRRVLQGAIKRGIGETIRAAIWFCDLRGFTALSETLKGSKLIDLLNDYFDVITTAIRDEQGEILKFIGDAVLAIFMPTAEDDETEATRRALGAAAAAQALMKDRNAERHEAGKPEIGYGIALHFGDVLYGNVGGEDRLDFTVIGPAVNLASRIEGLTAETGQRVLVSAEFAAIHGGRFDSLGEFALKGISEKRAVYTPSDDT